MIKQRRRQPNARRKGASLYSVPLAVTALTVVGIAAAVILSNLPGGGGSTSPREIGVVGHDLDEQTLGPDLHFANTGVDFGVVPLGKEVSYSFSFANIGSETLRILGADVRVLEGCWPFQPIIGSMMLAPGETSSVSFSTHMMEGMEGPHTFEIVVKSNDSVEPESVLTVIADFGGRSQPQGGH